MRSGAELDALREEVSDLGGVLGRGASASQLLDDILAAGGGLQVESNKADNWQDGHS